MPVPYPQVSTQASPTEGAPLYDLAMGLTAAQAAEILGTTPRYVDQLVHRGALTKPRARQRAGLDLVDVEQLALERWNGPGHPYWATSIEATEILGVSRSRVLQLADRGRVPAVRHNGRWFFRRAQLEVVANARDARKWARA